jgi:NADH-quinone oxidoreductase subunit G
MATIYIDDIPYEVADGQSLLDACLSLGFDVPYFCWHPALHSVGACRQCAVKQFRDEKDKKGMIVMSCMTPASNGARISIDDPEVKQFRAAVIEFLMMNHPHDCPICDEGGECHLQDMTLMTGHVYRNYRFKKRTWKNQHLGPFIKQEMNRCIECYRCVRFYRDYAGGRDFDVFGIGMHVFFGRFSEGTLESEFSGNLVEVCPTGVFTDKTLKKHYTRKWDLQTAPSVCVHCGLGCNTIPGERYGTLKRIYNRYNHEVNGYFLCDRGRFGYEFVNSDRRIRTPLIRSSADGSLRPASRQDAIEYVGGILKNSKTIIGIGSPRASIESNFALRTLVGAENFYSGMAAKEHELVSLIYGILSNGSIPSASLRDVEASDAVLVLAEDVPNSAPRLALTLRQSARQKLYAESDRLKVPRWNDNAVRFAVQFEKSPFYVASPCDTRLDDIAVRTYHAAPDSIARLGFSISAVLSVDAPRIEDLPGEIRRLAGEIAEALKDADRPLVVSGTSCGSTAVIQAAANIAKALQESGKSPKLCFTVPECNSMGMAMLAGGGLHSGIERVIEGKADTVIILENDLFRREDRKTVERFFQSAQHVVTLDHLINRTALQAEAVLSATTFAEGDGTFVNNEGRGQRFFQVMNPREEVRESWRWLRDVMVKMGKPEVRAWQSLDDVIHAVSDAFPVLHGIDEIAAPGNFRIRDMKIARQSHRYSGRTAMHADVDIHEDKPPEDLDSPFSFSMEGYQGRPPSALIPRFWAPNWNSVQSVNKFQAEIGGQTVGGDPGRRLIEPAHAGKASYFTNIPEPFQPKGSEWLLVPVYHVFGSEELSVSAPAVEESSVKPYLGVSVEDAESLNLKANEEIKVILNEMPHCLPIRLYAALPTRVAVLPAGLSGIEYVELPAWAAFQREDSGDKQMVLALAKDQKVV